MYFKNILVPYDESDHALSALHTALALAGPYPEAQVPVITVLPAGAPPGPPLMGDGVGTAYAFSNPVNYEQLMDSVVERSRAEVDEAVRQSLDDAKCQVTTDAIISSSPVEGIAEYVERQGIDLVIMGRRGLGALRGMLGSVSFGVLRSVEVPVLTVK